MYKICILLIFLVPIIGIAQSDLSFVSNLSGIIKKDVPSISKDILKLADFYRGGHIPGISWNLKVKNWEKEVLRNEIELLVEGSVNEDKLFALISFESPKKYRGQKLLIRNNNMWFYKTGLRRPVAISSRQRLSGSAANADVASANYYNDYDIVEVKEVKLDESDCWLFSLVAKDKLVSYYKIDYWINTKNNQGIKAAFYGTSGRLIKTAFFEYNQRLNYNKKEIPFISKIRIEDNINSTNKTSLEINRISLKKFSNTKFQKERMID